MSTRVLASTVPPDDKSLKSTSFIGIAADADKGKRYLRIFILIAGKGPYEATGNFEKDFKEFSVLFKSLPIPITTDKSTLDNKPKIRLQMDPASPEHVLSVAISGFAVDPPLARTLAAVISASTLTTLK